MTCELAEVSASRQLVTTCFDTGALAVARVVGSVAYGNARPDSDIDLLICPFEPAGEAVLQSFQIGYFALHESFGRQPDRNYPGEVVDVRALEQALDRAARSEPVRKITDSLTYDGIVWAGMLSGRCIDLVPPSPITRRLSENAVGIVRRWATALDSSVARHAQPDKYLAKETTYAG